VMGALASVRIPALRGVRMDWNLHGRGPMV